MDFYSLSTVQSVGGAALIVTLITAVLKSIFGVCGRRSQIIALCLSLVIAGIIGDLHTFAGVFFVFVNACVITATALGIDQAANYNK